MRGPQDAHGPSNSTRRIVVGVDRSRFGVAALRWALCEADRFGCTVEAIMAWQPDSGLSDEQQQRLFQALAESVASALRTTGRKVAPREVLARGWPPEILVRASEHAVLLVLGSHGRGRLLEPGVGSVLEYCLRHARCPVVVVPSYLATPSEQEVRREVPSESARR